MALISIIPSSGYTASKLLTPGTNIATAGSGVCVSASAPGQATLIMADGSQLTVFAALGTMVLPGLSVKGVTADLDPTISVFVLN